MTRENHVRVLLDSVSFSRIMCRAFRLRSRATAQLVYYLISLLSIPFLNFFEHFCFPFETQPERAHTLIQGDPDAKASFPPDGVSAACAAAGLCPGDLFRRFCALFNRKQPVHSVSKFRLSILAVWGTIMSF